MLVAEGGADGTGGGGAGGVEAEGADAEGVETGGAEPEGAEPEGADPFGSAEVIGVTAEVSALVAAVTTDPAGPVTAPAETGLPGTGLPEAGPPETAPPKIPLPETGDVSRAGAGWSSRVEA